MVCNPATKEQCIRIIYQLVRYGNVATVSDTALSLHLSQNDARAVIDELSGCGLVSLQDNTLGLTSLGRHIAKSILHNFEVVCDYLVQNTGLDRKTAVQVACALEHVLDFDMIDDLIPQPAY